MSAVFVWIETFKGKAYPSSWEALGAGKTIATKLGVPLTALVFGENADAVAAEAAQYGAEKVLVSGDATLNGFRLEPYAALLSKLVSENQPKAVLAIGTARGRELLAASAADTDSGLLTEITSLETQDDGAVKVTRPVYAGKIVSEAVGTAGGTQFLALRGRAFKANEPNTGAKAEVTTVAPVLAEDAIPTKIESFEEETGTVNLTDA